MYTPDSLDERIMRELERDARQSLRKVSRKLGVSITTISKRMYRLKKEGIIKGYSVVLDPEKMGFELTAVIEIVVSKGKLVEVEESISRKKNVLAVYDVTGSTDALVLARFKKRSDMSMFIKSLLGMRYIERTNTHVVLNVVKEDMRALA